MANVDEQDAFNALLRLDFAFFLRVAFRELGGLNAYSHNWHIDAIIHQLDQVCEGSNKRLIITMPPRHLKSRTVSIAWVAWMMGHNPALSFICASYGQSLSEDYARDCLQIMESKWYRKAFPRVVLTRRAVDDIQTSAGGRRMATSVDGPTTGFGADIIIVDDPMKSQDALSLGAREKVVEWFDTTLENRLTNPETGAIILVMQRLHEGDLAGVLRKRKEWRELCLPSIAPRDEAIALPRGRTYLRREGCALHPARLSLNRLREQQTANPYVFAAQHLQDPIPAIGNIVEASWLQSFDLSELNLQDGQIIMSLDTASKDNPFNDYSAFVVARLLGKSIHVVDVFRARLKFPDLKAKTIELARLHGVKVLLIEDAASGQQLIQTLRADEPRGVPSPIARRPQGDKIARAMGVTAMIQAGRYFLPEKTHWLGDYTGELLGFPSATYDDQVDATTQLLAWVQEQDMYREPLNAGPVLVDAEDPDYDSDYTHHLDPDCDPWGA